MSGRTCVLEPLNPERHARDLFEANRADDGRMWTYLSYGPFETLDAYRTWLKATCQGNDPLFYAVVPRETEKAAGLASYLRTMPEAGNARDWTPRFLTAAPSHAPRDRSPVLADAARFRPRLPQV